MATIEAKKLGKAPVEFSVEFGCIAAAKDAAAASGSRNEGAQENVL